MITSPYLKEYTDEAATYRGFYDQYYGIINQAAEETGALYYDYSKDERFSRRPDLFMDSHHLNKEGARLFTDILFKEVIEAEE